MAKNSLSEEDIEKDLASASHDDIIFDPVVFAEVNGGSTPFKSKSSKEENCYKEVIEYLKGEAELQDLKNGLFEKKKSLKELEDTLNKSIRLMQEEQKEFDATKT